jgi:hypothetical protein
MKAPSQNAHDASEAHEGRSSLFGRNVYYGQSLMLSRISCCLPSTNPRAALARLGNLTTGHSTWSTSDLLFPIDLVGEFDMTVTCVVTRMDDCFFVRQNRKTGGSER